MLQLKIEVICRGVFPEFSRHHSYAGIADTFLTHDQFCYIKNALENDVTLNLLATQLNVTVATLQQLRDFLSNDDNPNDDVTTWKDLYRQFNGIITTLTKVRSNCNNTFI